MAANAILGLRKNEMMNLKVSDVSEYERNGRTIIELSYKGKGGKNCHSFYYDEELQNFIRNLIAGKKSEEKVFKDYYKQFSYDADLYSARRAASVRMYQHVMSHPEDRDFYMSELKRVFEEKGKTLPAEIDGIYKLRGRNKIEHENLGLETELSKFECLCCSTLLLNHYRIGVSVTNYLLHP